MQIGFAGIYLEVPVFGILLFFLAIFSRERKVSC